MIDKTPRITGCLWSEAMKITNQIQAICHHCWRTYTGLPKGTKVGEVLACQYCGEDMVVKEIEEM